MAECDQRSKHADLDESENAEGGGPRSAKKKNRFPNSSLKSG